MHKCLLHTRFEKDELNLCLEGPMGHTKKKRCYMKRTKKKKKLGYIFSKMR